MAGHGGHNQKPTQLKILRGTFRNSRAKKGEPKPKPLTRVPPPPKHLNSYGKAIWKQLAPELVDKMLMSVLDLQTLEVLCDAYGLYREARAAVYRDGRTLRQYLAGQNSQTIPEVGLMRQCWYMYKSLLSEFGLSPSSRAKMDLPAPKKPEQDPMEKLLNEG